MGKYRQSIGFGFTSLFYSVMIDQMNNSWKDGRNK